MLQTSATLPGRIASETPPARMRATSRSCSIIFAIRRELERMRSAIVVTFSVRGSRAAALPRPMKSR